MEIVKTFLEKGWYINVIHSLVTVIVSVVIYKSIILFLNRTEKQSKFKLFTSQKGKTYAHLMKSIIRYIFIVVTVLIVLQINGINVSSVLAGVGILGVIFGFAIQDWLKDIIRGSSIISDNYFSVGDVVKYKDIEGKVLVVGLKTTKIQDLATSNVISIANRNIEEVQIVSSLVYIKVPMPYEVNVKRAEEIVDEIKESIKKNDNVSDCKYMGVTELDDSCIQYFLQINCNQQFKLQVRRDALRAILVGFEKNNIQVPYTQIDIHNK